MVEHRVVVHRGELEEHVTQAQQRNTQHERTLGPKDRLGVHEVHGEHADDDRAREPSEPDSAPTSSIGTLAGDGGEQGDEQARDRHAVAQPRRGRPRVPVKTPSLVRYVVKTKVVATALKAALPSPKPPNRRLCA